MVHTAQDERNAREYVLGNVALLEAIGATDPNALELSFLGAGEHNCNYVVHDRASGSRCVLRVNVVPQTFHEHQIAYEFAALEALGASRCTPRAIYMDTSDAAPREGALVMGLCEGDELDFDHLRPGDLRCAAQLMADIHSVPVAPECTLHRPAEPLDDLMAECIERFDSYRASGAEDARISHWVDLFCDAAAKAVARAGNAGTREHIVHTETLPSHFLVPDAAAHAAAANTAEHGAFCAAPGYVIDWERPVLAEPAQDVAYFTGPTMTFWDSDFMFPARDVETFVKDYWRAVDGRFERGNFDDRFSAYRMLTSLRSVGWCCKRLGMYGGLDKLRGDDKTARKLPVYLSDEFNEMLAEEVFEL